MGRESRDKSLKSDILMTDKIKDLMEKVGIYDVIAYHASLRGVNLEELIMEGRVDEIEKLLTDLFSKDIVNLFFSRLLKK